MINIATIALVLLSALAAAQSPRGHVVIRTIDESGVPIPGAFVTIRPSKPGAGLVELEALSDESGRAGFDGMPAGAYRVAAHLVGFHPPASTIDVAAERRVDVPLVMAVAPVAECVILSPDPAVQFRTRSGDQLPTAYLTVTRPGGRPRSHGVSTAGRPDCFLPGTPDHVTLDVLGYGEHVLKRAGEDPARQSWLLTIDPTDASRAGRTRPGQPVGQVRGRVFDEYGASIPDASVVFQPVDPRSGLTEFAVVADSRGRFDFEGVRTGTYRVTSRALGYAATVAIHEVKPGVQTEVTLTLRPVK